MYPLMSRMNIYMTYYLFLNILLQKEEYIFSVIIFQIIRVRIYIS
jgi:hypothetical protein